MVNTRRAAVIVCGVFALAAAGAPVASNAVAPSAAKTGKISVRVVSPTGQHAGKGFVFCATKHKAHKVGKIEGKCGTTHKNGVALLTKVPVGKRYYTLYISGRPTETFGRAKVVSGHTTKVKVVLGG
jgi:uncharacterized low-complexity protein